MSSRIPPDQMQRGIQRVYAKAWKDSEFRQALLRDPRGTIEKEYGLALPQGLDIQVHEQTDQTLHLILPPKPLRASGGELSDEEVDMVAGGSGPSWTPDQPNPDQTGDW